MQDKNIVPSPRPDRKTRRLLSAYGGWRRRRFEELQSTANNLEPYEPPAPTSGYFEAERRRPARPANVESDFIVPLFQALAVTIMTSLGGLYLSTFWNLFIWHLACFGGLAAGAAWFIFALMLGRELLWIVERVTNHDFDGDGHIGKPEPRTIEPLEVIHKDERGSVKHMFRLDVAIDDHRLNKFLKALALGESLAEANWIGGGNLFSKAEFGKLLKELQRAGVIEWVNPDATSQGRRLTETGLDSITRWAAHTHTQRP